MNTPGTASSPDVLVISSMYPSARYPKYGTFVADAVRALRAEGVTVRPVVSGDARTGPLRNALKYSALLFRAIGAAFGGGFGVVHAHYLYPPGAIGAGRFRPLPPPHLQQIVDVAKGGVFGRTRTAA